MTIREPITGLVAFDREGSYVGRAGLLPNGEWLVTYHTTVYVSSLEAARRKLESIGATVELERDETKGVSK